MKPTLGRIVIYRTDGRNGLAYDLPAIITCTEESHPGDYPTGETNPLVPPVRDEVHLTVFTPGGFGTTLNFDNPGKKKPPKDKDFKGAEGMRPGSGTYVELSVPYAEDPLNPPHRSWRWPERV
jgi:hypothetical protein